jgi:hypothetical protein
LICQRSIAEGVVLSLPLRLVYGSVDFHESQLSTIEVQDEPADAVLSSELEAETSSISQDLPG